VFGHRSAPNVIGVFGNLGNLYSEVKLLDMLRSTMSAEDLLLLEVRLKSEATIDQLAAGSSLEHDFGPLEQYFGLKFSAAAVSGAWATDVSDFEGTQTLRVTYNGELPGFGPREVKLQYIHLYDPDHLLAGLERLGFDCVYKHAAMSSQPPFLECLLRRS
jgi:hypothetical protein